ncbi:MAG: DinB family protein [Planctomycetes bacterium]|nr:DinB family protein [Planctomycetota bacterium]
MSDPAAELARGVAEAFARRLAGEYVPRIRQCVELLDDAQLWHRPGPHNNSIGNLLLHLEGNTRQWILAGVGGATDTRTRPAEFGADGGSCTQTGAELVAQLAATVDAAVRTVTELTPVQLLETKRFQSRWDETCLSAVLHVLEHFSGHAGQIYAQTKQLCGIDLKFYDL